MEINEPGVTAAQARVLAPLREAGRALTLVELRDRSGLHPTTLGGHLDASVEGGNETKASSAARR